MSLEILACPSCRGLVPLVAGNETRCPFCAATVEIPPDYRALRDAEKSDAATRTDAERLYAELGREPSRMRRALVVLFNPWVLILGGFFAMLLIFFLLTLFVISRLSPLLHRNLVDVLPDAVTGYGTFGITAGILLLLTIAGVHARRRVVSLQGLQAALAARPPTREGESLACRECGAPLVVPPDALGVRCTYCRADNLVAMPASWVAGVRADASRVHREIATAAQGFADETARLARVLRRQLGITALVLLVFIGFVALGGHGAGWRQHWEDHTRARREIVRQLIDGQSRDEKAELAVGDACRAGAFTVPAKDCSNGRCSAWYYLALRRGERLALSTTDLPDGSRARAQMHTGFGWFEPPRPFGDSVVDAALTPGTDASFVAPWDAWYQLEVSQPSPARAFGLCATVTGP